MRTFILLAATLILGACSSMNAKDFAGTTPTFKVEEYFLGTTKAWGIFEDRFGKLRRQFVVDIKGELIAPDTIRLTEDFKYSDGEVEQRIWEIKRTGDNAYEGRAAGVDGIAVGEAYGQALRFRYHINLKVGDNTWYVKFDDWMFLLDEKTLINRARVYRWGIEIGEVTLFFQKQ